MFRLNLFKQRSAQKDHDLMLGFRIRFRKLVDELIDDKTTRDFYRNLAESENTPESYAHALRVIMLGELAAKGRFQDALKVARSIVNFDKAEGVKACVELARLYIHKPEAELGDVEIADHLLLFAYKHDRKNADIVAVKKEADSLKTRLIFRDPKQHIARL